MWMWMWVRLRVKMSGRSETSPQVDCHLLFAIEGRSARLKGTNHLLDDLLEEQAGQLRVQERLKLKGHLRTTAGVEGMGGRGLHVREPVLSYLFVTIRHFCVF